MMDPVETCANSNGLKYDETPGRDKGYKVIYDKNFSKP